MVPIGSSGTGAQRALSIKMSGSSARSSVTELNSKWNSLERVESQLEVSAPVLSRQGIIIEGLREETVGEGTEGQTVAPTAREVFNVDVLK